MKSHKKEIKKAILILSLLSCMVTIYQIVNVYAAFESELFGDASGTIAKWHIIVNEVDIVNATPQEFLLGNLITEGNERTAAGKLAPGASGSFEIAIEPKDTQVSVRYDISINQSNLESGTITLASVEDMGEGVLLVKTDENTYTGVIPLTNIVPDYIKNVKITFIWEDDDVEDVILGTTANLTLQVPVSVVVSQYMGETIEQYAEPGEPIGP